MTSESIRRVNAENRQIITSEEYVDLVVEFNQNENLLRRYTDGIVQVMNDRYAVVYVPAAQLDNRFITTFGYNVLPSCYGLMSQISLEASGVIRLRRSPVFNLLGEGVLVGLVDTGIDYTNPIFRNADGSTRIAAIWDQTIDSDRYPEYYFYGTEYLEEDINQALQSENPLEVLPSTDENGHGTMLAGIAAGNVDTANNFSGVVPGSKLAIVKLKQAKRALLDFYLIPQDAVAYQENDIMWGLQYLIGVARRLNMPIAICIGLGSSQGPHDGRSTLSHLISVGANFPGVSIVTAAGNEGNTRRHYFSRIRPDSESSVVELNVGENESGFTMELWGTAPNTYSIDILSPSGEYIPRIVEGLRVNRTISFVFERTVIYVDYVMIEARTGDQVIVMRFENPTSGIWRFQVYTRGDLEGSFHIWLPITAFISPNTYFVESDPYTTITSPGTSINPITVTAYNPSVNNNLYQSASRGYTRIGEIKPDVAAPGVNIQAPDLQQGYTQISGTGAAAAHTTGIAAILLEWAIVRNNYPGVDSAQIKRFLIRGASRNPNLSYPNRDWGYGIVDIYNVFDILRASTQDG